MGEWREKTGRAMNGETLRRTVIVKNSQGMHLRPITAFAELANKYQSNILVGRQGEAEMVSGKSPFVLLSVMLVEKGTELILEAAGPDADQAMDALVKFFDDIPDVESV